MARDIAYKQIPSQDLYKTPWKAHKRYEVNNINASSSFEIMVMRAISDNGILTELSKSISNGIAYDNTLLTGSVETSGEFARIPQKVIWNSINTQFFKNTDMVLYPTASVISIPQYKYGLGIKPNSFNLTQNTTHLSESKYNDIFGYVYDVDINSDNFVSDENLRLYLGFQDGVIGNNWKISKDSSNYKNKVIPSNVIVVDGIDTTDTSDASGYGIKCTSQSSVVIPNSSNFTFLGNHMNWSISLWAKLPTSQSYTSGGTTNPIITKKYQYTTTNGYGNTITKYTPTQQYPFDLSIHNQTSTYSGRVDFTAKSVNTVSITSSLSSYNDGNWHNYIVNYDTNNYYFYIDGTLQGSSSAIPKPIINTYDTTVMGYSDYMGTGGTGTSGSIDEIRMYNTSLTAGNISSLSTNTYDTGSAYQTKNVGCVFYNEGIIIITDPRPKYKNIALGDGNFDYSSNPYQFEYKGTKLLERMSIMIPISTSEFNVSTNPSLRLNNSDGVSDLQSFTTGSDFSPYVTSIGLYNSDYELVAIAKMGTPLKTRTDMDITIDVRLDFE